MSDTDTNEKPVAKKAKKAAKKKVAKKAAAPAAKKAAKKTARKTTTKEAGANAAKRVTYADDAKIKVVGENGRREGSRYHSGYENMKKVSTVAAFRKKHPDDATELLSAAIKDGYAKVS